MSYSKLGDEEAGGWPSKASLCELFEEREVELLEQITSGGGVGKLAEMLGSSTTAGISGEAADLAQRKSVYGVNAFAEKRLKSYLELVWDGLHDLTLILLMVMSAVSWVMETFFGDHPETGWIESVAIFVSVFIIVNVAASTDYVKERTFRDLSAQLDASNKKVVIRGGAQLEVQDCEIVVGDVLSFNAHNLASIPCDGLLLPGSEGVKMDEASLTGEPEPQLKSVDDAPWIVSGTSAVAGSGKVLVVAVGAASVSGKIREAVYGEDVEEEGSPLFQKLDALVVLIGKAGIAAALSCFTVMCFVGLIVKGEPLMMILEYTITTITIVAVAVPEGLPLAVTLALAFSSTKMMDENNLVKHLDACETMGSATTICSDKTGTLTANRMTVKAAWAFGAYLPPDNSSQVPLGVTLQSKLGKEARLMLATLVSVCSMDESYLAHNALTGKTDFKGNPTECALLPTTRDPGQPPLIPLMTPLGGPPDDHSSLPSGDVLTNRCALLSMTRDLGYEFAALRDATEGRSDSSRPSGASILFSSARKMMSWLVKRPSGGYRLYAKGASEIILERCSHIASEPHEAGLGRIELGDERKAVLQREVINTFAAEAMRTMGLAYRDFDQRPDCDALHPSATNANGTQAP